MNNYGLGDWTKADIERFYAKAAASGVYAPLDPGELDSMEDRFTGRVKWSEPTRNPERFITLTARWQAVVVEASALRGVFVALAPQTLRVVDVARDRFIVRHPEFGEVALVGALT